MKEKKSRFLPEQHQKRRKCLYSLKLLLEKEMSSLSLLQTNIFWTVYSRGERNAAIRADKKVSYA